MHGAKTYMPYSRSGAYLTDDYLLVDKSRTYVAAWTINSMLWSNILHVLQHGTYLTGRLGFDG